MAGLDKIKQNNPPPEQNKVAMKTVKIMWQFNLIISSSALVGDYVQQLINAYAAL